MPLVTERGVAQPTASAAERLTRSVVEAAKQCGRNRLMRVAKPQAWTNGSSRVAGVERQRAPSDPRRLLAHPDGHSLSTLDLQSPLPTLIAIGPEGGLTDAEVAAALAAGWQQVSLGARILRVETAAIALAAASP